MEQVAGTKFQSLRLLGKKSYSAEQLSFNSSVTLYVTCMQKITIGHRTKSRDNNKGFVRIFLCDFILRHHRENTNNTSKI